ncbi:MAG: hypothetical protein ACEB74_14750 [Desulfovibrio aminophilus]|uniref:hypothetical protein n=1 Tax=Desulfovibrio aminophilus TaxID=81425 RepID=UPI0039EA2E0B
MSLLQFVQNTCGSISPAKLRAFGPIAPKPKAQTTEAIGLAVRPQFDPNQFQVRLEVVKIRREVQCRINARLEGDFFRDLACTR